MPRRRRQTLEEQETVELENAVAEDKKQKNKAKKDKAKNKIQKKQAKNTEIDDGSLGSDLDNGNCKHTGSDVGVDDHPSDASRSDNEPESDDSHAGSGSRDDKDQVAGKTPLITDHLANLSLEYSEGVSDIGDTPLKVSRKEMKKLKKQTQFRESLEQNSQASKGYGQFSVSQTLASGQNEAARKRLLEASSDILIENFSLSAPGRDLFVNASLKIVNKRRYGLVGPNGHGKTTLLVHLATRQLEGIPESLDILLCEQEVEASTVKTPLDILLESDDRVSKLKNDLEVLEAEYAAGNSDLLDRINQIYEELKSLDADSAESRALRILNGLGFDENMQKRKKLSEFSGGWRMRVSLARALFRQPTLLILDEPTNHLDLNAVIWLDNYLQAWKNTLLIVSHDQNFLDNVCTDIIHLDQHKLHYYRGNYDAFKKMLVQKRREQLKDYEKQEKELKRLKQSGKSGSQAESKLIFKKKTAKGSSQQQQQQHQLESDDDQKNLLVKPKEYQVKFSFPHVAPLSPPILGLFQVSFGFPGQPLLFKDLNFGVDLDSRIAIIGPNGVGKSTLLRLLTGDISPQYGEVRRNHRLRIGKFDQHSGDQLNLALSACEHMETTYKMDHQEARRRLGSVGLPGKSHVIPMNALSGGQKARVALADLAARHPDILILDEPTNNLDLESIDALAEAIKDYDGGVVLVSHDERMIRETDCQLWIVEDQNIAEIDGDFDTYRDELLESLGEKILTNPSAAASASLR